MKKQLYTIIACAAVAFPSAAFSVIQGQPWTANPMMRTATDAVQNPTPPEGEDLEFDPSTVENWSGEGSKSAYLVIQWNDEREENAKVFGYHYDGDKYGIDMINAVLKTNPQLYFMTHYTDYGYTIAGFGWDADADRDIALVYDDEYSVTPDHKTNTVTVTQYNYDQWTANDEDDFWKSGWYTNGYWSYWHKDSFDDEKGFHYSDWGASSLQLTDGMVNAWLFTSLSGKHPDWKELVPAKAVGTGATFVENGLSYRVLDTPDNAVEVTGSTLSDIVLDSSVEHGGVSYTINGIADGAFSSAGIASLAAKSLSYIGSNAFAGDVSLVSFSIESGLSYIGDNAFKDCTALTSANVPADWRPTDISGTSIFEGCSALKNVPLPADATSIAPRYFAGTGIEQYSLPASVTTIGDGAFASCLSLTEFTVERQTPPAIPADTFEGISETAVLNVPYQTSSAYREAAGWSAFSNYKEAKPLAEVGARFMAGDYWYTVTSIEPNEVELSFPGDLPSEFSYSVKSSYTVPDYDPRDRIYLTVPTKVSCEAFSGEYAVTAIGDFAFANISIYDLYKKPVGSNSIIYIVNEDGYLNKTIRRIGKYAFADFDVAEQVVLSEEIESFGEGAFYEANIKRIYCAKSLSNLSGGTSKVTELPDKFAYVYNSSPSLLTCGFLTPALTRLGDEALTPKNFQYAAYNRAVFENLTWIGKYNFPDYPDSEIKFRLNDNIEHIGALCGVTLDLENGTLVVKKDWELDVRAFQYTKGFEKVIIEEGRTDIPQDCFASSYAYGDAPFEIVLPSTLKTIGIRAFNLRSGMTGINLPEGLESIEQNAFADTGIKAVTLPSTLTSIGQFAFSRCSSLESFIMKPGIEKLAYRMLFNVNSLKDLVIAPTVRTIGDCFSNCDLKTTRIWDAIDDPQNTDGLEGIQAFDYWAKPQYTPYDNHYVLMGLGDKFGYEVKEIPVTMNYPETHNVTTTASSASIVFEPEFDLNLTGLGLEEVTVPEVFRDADIAYFVNNHLTCNVKYRKQGDQDWNTGEMSIYEEPETMLFVADETESTPRRRYRAELSDLDSSTTYEYQLSHTVGDNTYDEEQVRTFKTEDSKPTGIEDVSLADRGVFPNPASDHFSINAEGEIDIYTISGILVKRVMAESDSRTTVSVDSLPAGLYVVRYTADGKICNERLIIE